MLQIQRMLMHATFSTLISHLAVKCEKVHVAGKISKNSTGGGEEHTGFK